jgi:hypothetical protein
MCWTEYYITFTYKYKLTILNKHKQVVYYYYYYYYFFFLALQPSTGYGLLVSRGFLSTHNDAPRSVVLLWSSDQLVTETST